MSYSLFIRKAISCTEMSPLLFLSFLSLMASLFLLSLLSPLALPSSLLRSLLSLHLPCLVVTLLPYVMSSFSILSMLSSLSFFVISVSSASRCCLSVSPVTLVSLSLGPSMCLPVSTVSRSSLVTPVSHVSMSPIFLLVFPVSLVTLPCHSHLSCQSSRLRHSLSHPFIVLIFVSPASRFCLLASRVTSVTSVTTVISVTSVSPVSHVSLSLISLPVPCVFCFPIPLVTPAFHVSLSPITSTFLRTPCSALLFLSCGSCPYLSSLFDLSLSRMSLF